MTWFTLAALWLSAGVAFAYMLSPDYGPNWRDFLVTLAIIFLGPIPWVVILGILAAVGWRDRSGR